MPNPTPPGGVTPRGRTGPPGWQRPGPGRWTPWLVTGLTLAGGWFLRARCLFDGGWEGGEALTHYCYSDAVSLWVTRDFAVGAIPYLDERLEYPPLTGAQVYAAASLVRGIGGGAFAFYNVTAGLNAALLLATLGVLRRLGTPHRRQLWWAAAPALALHAFLNWDALPVFLLVLAVALHAERRHGAAGVAAGLGAAAKLFPALLVPVVVIARLRQHDIRSAARHAGGAALGWGIVNVPLALAAYDGWKEFFEFNRSRGANWATVWAVADQAGMPAFEPAALNRIVALTFAAGVGVVLAVGLRRRSPATTWTLVLPVLAWFLVTSKVFSPQYDLWLLPLLVFLLPSGGPVAAFLAADVAVFVTEFAFLAERAGDGLGLGYAPLGAAVCFRAAALLWIITVAVRRGDRPAPGSAPRPEPDAVVEQRPGRLHAVPDGQEEGEGGDGQADDHPGEPPTR